MKRDIRKWCQECHSCQSSKFHRHAQAPLQQHTLPRDRFRSLHVDLVGPLPVSQGMTYLFTVIDRLTRWPEVIPVPDAQATCAPALLSHWIARFGVPEDITRCGMNVTSSLEYHSTRQLHIIRRLTAWLSVYTANLKRLSKLA